MLPQDPARTLSATRSLATQRSPTTVTTRDLPGSRESQPLPPAQEPRAEQNRRTVSLGLGGAWAECLRTPNMNHSPFISSKQACNYQGLGSPLLRIIIHVLMQLRALLFILNRRDPAEEAPSKLQPGWGPAAPPPIGLPRGPVRGRGLQPGKGGLETTPSQGPLKTAGGLPLPARNRAHGSERPKVTQLAVHTPTETWTPTGLCSAQEKMHSFQSGCWGGPCRPGGGEP